MTRQLLGDSCNNCDFCSSNDDEYCENPSLLGCNINGTFQQYCICKATNIIRVPKDAPLDSIAPVLFLSTRMQLFITDHLHLRLCVRG